MNDKNTIFNVKNNALNCCTRLQRQENVQKHMRPLYQLNVSLLQPHPYPYDEIDVYIFVLILSTLLYNK